MTCSWEVPTTDSVMEWEAAVSVVAVVASEEEMVSAAPVVLSEGTMISVVPEVPWEEADFLAVAAVS